MPADPTRTVLVISTAPHPWALLRDRLDPGLVTVRWTAPEAAEAACAQIRPWPWAVAGTGATQPPARLHARPLLLHWVGPRPAPAAATVHGSWHDLAAALEAALERQVAGVRLAPARGLSVAGGRTIQAAAELEALLAAGPDGLALTGPPHQRRSVAERAGAVIARHELPLCVAWRGDRLVVEAAGVDAA